MSSDLNFLLLGVNLLFGYFVCQCIAHHLFHKPVSGQLFRPLPYTQPDPISRARFLSAFAWKRGASLPPRDSRRRRGMTRARPLV